uniref:Solute carrier organic anion transporter family member n=1 Tax=Acrobeloides nanus TaxID=290746 RepID=A0A914BVZ3_9BILA
MERQFHIPSLISSFLVSASELGYILAVIFISYIGSRGNRAKWCGAGAILMSIALILTASPNFIFPAEQPNLNMKEVKEALKPPQALFAQNTTLDKFFAYQPIRDRIPSHIRKNILAKFSDRELNFSNLDAPEFEYSITGQSLYSLDEDLMHEAFLHMGKILNGSEDTEPLINTLQIFVKHRQDNIKSDLKTIRRASIAPFAFCNKLVNNLQEIIKKLKCHEQPSNFGTLVIIFMTLFAMGIGRTTPWSLGIPLLDDNVKKRSMPVYFAIISFIKILGPITGFLVGSLANKLYFSPPAPPGLTANDPTWIGAWWLGFLVIGFVTIVPSCFLFFFPEGKSTISPKNENFKNGKSKKASLKLYDKHMDRSKQAEGSTAKGGLKRAVIGRILDVLAFKGYIVYLPKYLENHYGIPQYKVQLYMAAFGTFGFALGTVTGGFITKKFKLNGRKVALFVVIVSMLNISTFVGKAFLGCESIVNTIGLEGVPTNFNYTRSCNFECGCDDAKLFPVCDPSGQIYYSPCHAGCRHVSVIDLSSHKMEFSDCDCAPGKIVKKEFCHDNCFSMMVIFFGTGLLGAFIGGTGVVPGLLILLRSVPPATRSISLGVHGFLVSLLGTLPSPIIWATIIDSACLIWEETCSSNVTSRGACAIYNPYKLRIRMHVLYIILRTISISADLYVLYHAKDLNILDDDEENPEKNDQETPITKDNNIPMNNVH